MAHAIYGYEGSCKNIHGHSYELHVSVSSDFRETTYIASPGFIIDFKEIKKLVQDSVIERFDHQLLLSSAYITSNPSISSLKNIVIFEAEPTAENLLIYIKNFLQKTFPDNIQLVHLKIFETKNSYAEWSENNQ
ncbi:MAG: 6-carboxytetrahydropterin synthase [Ferruginibacter sp.]|nr:6-carboxytetrahydropterin synthase [Ferruginibacter sp.]